MKKNILWSILAILIIGVTGYFLLSDKSSGQKKNTDNTNPNTTSNPSSDPNLLLPDLKTESPTELYIIRNSANRRELRFDTTVTNIGDGPLEMKGVYDEEVGKTRATQRIKTKQGIFEEKLSGYFIFHEGHNHWHFEDFTELEIFSLNAEGSPENLMATTGKITFCIFDSDPASLDLPNAPERATYTKCKNPEIQGLSIGWSDTYDARTLGQQLDINDLPDGRYAFRLTADPLNRIFEKNEDNNSVIIHVEIKGFNIRVI